MYLFGQSTFVQTYCTLVFNNQNHGLKEKGQKNEEEKDKIVIGKKIIYLLLILIFKSNVLNLIKNWTQKCITNNIGCYNIWKFRIIFYNRVY